MANHPERLVVTARSRAEADRLASALVDAGVPPERVERIRGDADLRLRLLEGAMATARDGMCILEQRRGKPRIVYANQRFAETLDAQPQELVGQPLDTYGRWCGLADRRVRRAIDKGERFDGEVRATCPHGRRFIAEVHVTPIVGRSGTASHFVLTQRDVTEQRAQEEHLHHLAHHDALTGLPNRKLFLDRLDQALRRAEYAHERVGLLFIDLDQFKEINDRHGHTVGDRLLRSVADRIRALMRGTDIVARLGGDEFTAVLSGLVAVDDAVTVARKLLSVVSAPMRIDGHRLTITPSIGVAVYPDHGSDVEALLHHADHAMYVAKDEGRARYAVWAPAMSADTSAHAELVRAVEAAVDQGALQLAWQPVVDGGTGGVLGAEALVRWLVDGRGPELPERLLPLANESGRAADVDAWVLRHACAEAARWPTMDGQRLPAVANLSAALLQRDDLVDVVEKALADAGLPSSRLELDVSEPVLLELDDSSLTQLATLRRIGVRVNVDDVGTGHLSLHHLGFYPVDAMKLDPSVVHQVEGGSRLMVRGLVWLAEGLGLDVVAEGVETEAQRQALLDLGCWRMQGNLFAEPKDGGALRKWLERRRHKTA